jgi:hypothetical protein
MVQVFFVGSSPSEHLMHESQVPAFVEAQKRLHFDPGVNPANGRKTARIWQILVGRLEVQKYWWTSPSLETEDSRTAGVLCARYDDRSCAWVDQTYVDKIDAEEDAMEDAWERRNYGR